ncbi:hypothetical protein BESB_084490 [Besnoitia besnoiti]|uniref:RRM domain-containing protein n=1 Tax=Besnoitia besnoiti TaxID=94643 RepID=A0A2A9MCX8_BESBE|nr:hypothetical protein BESB_084490 [Besnoitia besnoiti]PFH33250.1 hypothetical protein BESB_084490 [Besnoitia besnoiti]
MPGRCGRLDGRQGRHNVPGCRETSFGMFPESVSLAYLPSEDGVEPVPLHQLGKRCRQSCRYLASGLSPVSALLIICIALVAAARACCASWFFPSHRCDPLKQIGDGACLPLTGHLTQPVCYTVAPSPRAGHAAPSLYLSPRNGSSISRLDRRGALDACNDAALLDEEDKAYAWSSSCVPPSLLLHLSPPAAFGGGALPWIPHRSSTTWSPLVSTRPARRSALDEGRRLFLFLSPVVPVASVVRGLCSPGASSRHLASECASSSALFVYRNKVLHINPVRRVKHLKRNSGRSHIHELARERYLLHRQKDVRDYYRIKIHPHVDNCPHSQRNAAIKKPYRGVNEARREENRRLNAEDDARDEARISALRAFLDAQAALVRAATQQNTGEAAQPGDTVGGSSAESQAGVANSGFVEHELEATEGKQSEAARWASFDEVKKACEELQLLLRKRRMLRPLGSNKLFVSGVDDRLMNSDIEDFLDFFFRKTKVKLHKNADGTHRGSGLITFETTMDATQCLLEFNGVRLGAKRLFLAEALGPPLKPKAKKVYLPPTFPFGTSPAAAPPEEVREL